MTAQLLILKHDQWRKGQGGAAAGVDGKSDSSGYAGLDLDHITFTGSSFSGTSFSATTFIDASWSGCQFNHCTFTDCDLHRISIIGTTFVGCSFTDVRLARSNVGSSTFTGCNWNGLNFDHAHWSDLKLLSCTGTRITGEGLIGDQVDFTGSQFNDMHLTGARIN